jgi:hypothetical protein
MLRLQMMPRQKLEQVHLALGALVFLAMRHLLTASRLARSPLLAALPMRLTHQHWLQLLLEPLGKFCNRMEQVRHRGLHHLPPRLRLHKSEQQPLDWLMVMLGRMGFLCGMAQPNEAPVQL